MKLKVFSATLLTLAASLFLFATITHAQTFRTEESPSIFTNETLDESAYIAGSSVDVAGTVNGDLYCAGQDITISGTINGDVICAGQTISISGQVTGDVRAAGQTIAIRGSIGKSITAIGQTVNLEREGRIGQDASLFAQKVLIYSQVARDITIGSDTAVIGSTIGRNVTATVQSLRLLQNTTIAGTLTYTSPSALTRAQGAVTEGRVIFNEQKQQPTAKPPTTMAYPIGALIWSLLLVASAVLFAVLFPQLLTRVTAQTVESPQKALFGVLTGLMAAVVAPIILVLLMITIIGIPFAMAALLAWLLIGTLSGAFAAYYVGRIIVPKQTNSILIMLTGAVVLGFLLLIPIINIAVVLIAHWYGTGVILATLKQSFQTPNYTLTKDKKANRRPAV